MSAPKGIEFDGYTFNVWCPDDEEVMEFEHSPEDGWYVFICPDCKDTRAIVVS